MLCAVFLGACRREVGGGEGEESSEEDLRFRWALSFIVESGSGEDGGEDRDPGP